MKTNVKNMRVEMYRVANNPSPFVKVDYRDKNNQMHAGLLLLDSCSEHNVLSGEMAAWLNEQHKMKDECTNILTATGETVKTETSLFSFECGGEQFKEKFCISEHKLPDIEDELPFIGILGNEFMQEYKWVIDYTDHTVYSSYVTPEILPISDCDFFFPMEIGLNLYGLPALQMCQGEFEAVALADTGANDNSISLPALAEDKFHCQYQNTLHQLTGMSGSMKTIAAVMDYQLVTLRDDKENTGVCNHKDCFLVVPHFLIPEREVQYEGDTEILPPVVALIGSEFMEREGWVLDFGVKYIYKRKERTDMKKAV